LVREWGQGKAAVKLLVNERNRGKGFSVKRGMLEATGDILVFSDADLSTPIEELDRYLPLLADGAHIVIGSRALPNSDLVKQQALIRRSMGKVFNWIVQTMLFSGIPDTQCGFKCFTASAAREVFSAQRLEGFSFDAEILFIARKRGLVVRDVPVRWMNRADSRVRLLSDSCRMLCDLFRIRANDWQGRYDLPY
jgi:dolichyl-phosphate beta-glucosyltransferase